MGQHDLQGYSPAGLLHPSICEWVQEEEATPHCTCYKAPTVEWLIQEHMESSDPSSLTHLPNELWIRYRGG